MSIPIALREQPFFVSPGPSAIAAVLILGLLATGFATLLYFRLVQGPGPAFLSLVNYLVPGWAVLAGILFLGEEPASGIFLGLVLILLGIAIGEFGPRGTQWINERYGRNLMPRQAPAGSHADKV